MSVASCRLRRQAGVTLLELLVSVGLVSVILSGVAALLIRNSAINRTQQLASEAQANARNSLSIIVQALRSSGWDPRDTDFAPVIVDPDLGDSVSIATVNSDFNGDGDIDDPDEAISIRHTNGRIEWRKSAADPYTILAVDVSNDADGDGTVEPMFVYDDPSNPTRVTVQITTVSPIPDPISGTLVRHTVSTNVVLRNRL
jgi:prepilin-type N-terminal cleavage/methylation domain-containing protein